MRFFLQKKIIALAVAGLVSGVAFAQTNVTVYGKADLGYIYSKSDYKKFHGIEQGNGISSGSSRLGFMGEEALGNGLKAIFKFEWGINADIGTGPGVSALGKTNRQRYSYVGLAGNFGQVTLGRDSTPFDYGFGATGAQGINGIEPINQYRVGLLGEDRWDNSISYKSPVFSGFSFMGIYSFGEKVTPGPKTDGYGYNCTGTPPSSCVKASKGTDAGKFGLGVKYANGPLYLIAAYNAQADGGKTYTYDAFGNQTGSSIIGSGSKSWGLGGSYDFKVVKLFANYLRSKVNHESKNKQSAWSIGVGVPVSANGTVSFEYAGFKDARKSYGKTGDKAGESKGFGIGYIHTLSKRTSLYAAASSIDNDVGIEKGFEQTRLATGKKQTNLALGIVHNF